MSPLHAEADPLDLASLDLVAPEVHAESDLSPVWRHLRTDSPLYRHPPRGDRPGFWVVTRHEDAVAVLRDGHRFTSTSGNVLETLLAGGDSATGKMLAVADGPRHAEVRRIIANALTPAVYERLTDRIEKQVHRLVGEALGRPQCDFGTEVAAQVPLATICDMLDVPDGDREYVQRLGSSSVSSHSPAHTTTEAWTSKNEILAYFIELVEERRGGSGDDLITTLANARVQGRPLGTDEIVFNCYSLILGGDETTRLAMTGAVLALAENPEQWRALQRGEAGDAAATDEVLRWTTPTRHLGRTATETVEIAGGTIEAGDIVTVWLASANFDEHEFGDPERFRLDRTPNRHLTFAYGPHFCLGARLGRVQLSASLAALRGLVAEIELTGAPKRIYSNFLGGTCNVPVLLTAR